MANFRIGQKVVCINDSIGFMTKCKNGLVSGNIYTVIDINSETCGIRLMEVKNPPTTRTCNGYFDASRFSPVQSQYNSASFELASTFKETLETSDQPIKIQEREKANG